MRHVYYVRDAQGNVLAIYEQSQQTGPGGSYSALALTEQPLYGSSRLGLRKLTVSPTGVATESFRRVVGQKQYELSDHLGNVRALVSDIKRPDEALAGTYKPDLLAYYGYYPFGMLQPGRSAPANGTLAGGYRYGYNGKEKDNNGELGLTTYDYGFRIYSPGLARFLSVDPLTISYPWYTPYQFAGNSPIAAIDLDGGEEKIVTLNTGKSSSSVALVTTDVTVLEAAQAAEHLKRTLDLISGPSLLERLAPAATGAFLLVALVLRPVNSEQQDIHQGTLYRYEMRYKHNASDANEYENLNRKAYTNLSDDDKKRLNYLTQFYGADANGNVQEYHGPLHHIFTNKNFINGEQWSKKFFVLFERAGYDLNDAINKVNVPGHKGPHPIEYHQSVYNRLTQETQGLNGTAYKEQFERTLNAIKKEAVTPGTKLNDLLQKK